MLEGGFNFPNPSPLDPHMIWICSICFAPGMDIIRSRSLRTLYGTLYETSYVHTSSCSSPGCRGGVTQAKWLVQISHLVEPLYRTHSFRQEWWTLDKYPRQSHSVELKPSSSQTTFKWYDREFEIITHFFNFGNHWNNFKLFGTEVLEYLNSFLPVDKFYTQILS